MDIKRLKTLAGLNESHVREGVRDVTNALHAFMDEGILDPRQVADAALRFMSEDDVAMMAHNEEFPTSEEDLYGDDMEEGVAPEGLSDEEWGKDDYEDELDDDDYDDNLSPEDNVKRVFDRHPKLGR